MTPAEMSSSRKPSLTTRILVGAAIGLAAISLFLFPIRHVDPSWGKWWMLRPLILVTIAGATGGACSHFIMRYRFVVGMSTTVATMLSVLVFIVGLWLGTVLGLDGTLWD